VYADQRAAYYEALREADVGRIQPMVDFIGDRGLDQLALMSAWLRAAGRRTVAEQVAELDAALRSHGGLPHAEVDAAGRRALQYVQQAVSAQLEGQLPEPPWRTQVVSRVGRGAVPADVGDVDFRAISDGSGFQVLLRHDDLGAQVDSDVAVGVARRAGSRFTFRIADLRHRDYSPLRLRLGEVYPELTGAATTRMVAWAEDLVHELLAELQQQTAAAVKQQGFE
jgi:hypothetical protein